MAPHGADARAGGRRLGAAPGTVLGAVLGGGLLYFAMLFGAGFALGPVRVMVLEPRVGPFLAVLCEAPFLAAAMWLAAPRALRWARVGAAGRDALLVGLVAAGALAGSDIGLGLLLRGRDLAAQWDYLRTPAGGVYLACVLAFALMPFARRGAAARQPAPRRPG